MKQLSTNESVPKNEYWDLITKTLSKYEEKNVLKEGEMNCKLIDTDYFLENDAWDIAHIGQISQFRNQFESYKGTSKKITFPTEKKTIALELKFICYHKLFSEQWKLNSLFGNNIPFIKKLISFLNKKYPHLVSLLDLNIEVAEKEWFFSLHSDGVKMTSVSKNVLYGGHEYKTPIANFLRHIHNELFNLTDSREEWDKDRWDVRILNGKFGIAYNDSRADYYLDFSSVRNIHFKIASKKYIKNRLLGGKRFSWATAQNYTQTIPKFLNFINEIEPEWNDLKKLTRGHIEKYLEHLQLYSKNKSKNKVKNPKRFISHSLVAVYKFLHDSQRFEQDIAPKITISKLIFPEDYPKLDKKSDDVIDHIPDYVLDQLFRKIDELNVEVQPIVWIAFKTGLRISDALGLTQNCLVKLNGNYSIVTDIEKTYVKGHRIPIDEQLASIIATLIDKSKELSTTDNNPNQYLFVRYGGVRKGKPFDQLWVRTKLNEFAIKQNITDELGNVFHFKTHQFRHTYAVRMINGGADILTVQELLAHASPEMTMRYARLLDDTKRKAFEKVVKQGVFSFDLNGQIHEISDSEDVPEGIIDMLWKNEKLNALDNPYGSCRARINGNCPLATEPPCLTANDGKPCFDLAVGMSDMDVKKYEIHIDSTLRMIETAKQFGREDMVTSNQKNLERYQNIYETIVKGNVIFGRMERLQREVEKKRKKEK